MIAMPKVAPVEQLRTINIPFWLILWLSLNLIDYLITLLVLSSGGIEFNLIMAFTQSYFALFTSFKLAITIDLPVILYKFRRFYLLEYCCAGMMVIIFWLFASNVILPIVIKRLL